MPMPLPMQILLVEDEGQLRTLLHLALQQVGYTVGVAGHGQEALELFALFRFDLVLSDVRLPGMDGFTLCAELRKFSTVPIILMTALTQVDKIVYGYALGADDYITKPFFVRELIVRIQVLLRRVAAPPVGLTVNKA